MNLRAIACGLTFLVAGLLAAHGEGTTLSAQRLDLLDQRGYFTPAFKQSVHRLVEARQTLARTRAEDQQFRSALPALRRECALAQSQNEQLRQQLNLYAHPEESDIVALEAAMTNPALTPEQQLPLAQAFVWSYPYDPHQAEAMQDLQKIHQEIDARNRALAAENSSRTAQRNALIQRAKAGALSIAEWQTFLNDAPQQELLDYLGHPQSEAADCWIYKGSWTTDPTTQKRTGLRVTFNGTRVLRVLPYRP